jgi:putative aldouronate transport system permease protein
MNAALTRKARPRIATADWMYYLLRISVLLAMALMFFPDMSPAKISALINKSVSLFSAGLSYASVISDSARPLRLEWVQAYSYQWLHYGSMAAVVGIALAAACGCMSLGSLRLKRLGNIFGMTGGALILAGMGMICLSYSQFAAIVEKADRIGATFPAPIYLFAALGALTLCLSIGVQIALPHANTLDEYKIEPRFRLFLMFLPIVVLSFVFAYLPLYGWRYAFYDYRAGGELSSATYVGFKYFEMLVANEATRNDMIRVLRNTLVMSGLGLATSWVPLTIAILMAEVRNKFYLRTVQTIITIPNFISWVLVYAVALAMFSTDGFVNGFLGLFGVQSSTNYLMGNQGIWLKMLAWGMWKGVGWSSIIYVAAISGIDVSLYEAATVDGAGRFQKMRYITLPGLMPTYMVLLLLGVAAILSNGMDQYFVFENAQNASTIEVLDLYVYNIGIGKGTSIPLSTIVGMFKTVISLALLFIANRASKAIRGESIV